MKFLRMKYQMFLMRLFDKFLNHLKKMDLDWYPKHLLGVYDLDDKVDSLENEVFELTNELQDMKYRQEYEEYEKSVNS